MAKGKAQGKTKHMKRVPNSWSAASVSAIGFQICWCKGFGVGCGHVQAESTRQFHARRVAIHRESNYFLYWCVRNQVLTLGIAGDRPERGKDQPNEQNIIQEQTEDHIEDIHSQTLGSLQEGAFDIGNEHSPPILNPVNLPTIHADETYMNEQQYISPEPCDSCLTYSSIFQPHVEDPNEGLQDSEDNESNPEITNGVVIFEPDTEPDTVNKSEYHFKIPPLHTVEEAQRLKLARHVDNLGNSILE